MENRGKIEMIKNKYPVGTRIKLNYMDDNYSVPCGSGKKYKQCCGK